MDLKVPVVLFAYNRPQHLRQTLGNLHANRVPIIYAFSDGARSPGGASSVSEVREVLREVDWCEIIVTERDENLGLGRSILTGVTEVLSKHNSVIVFEDDLVCVPGAYNYLAAALHAYADCLGVMSVTGWTHPSVTPDGITDQPYFDGRAECWVWGTWTRAWQGMEENAVTLMERCAKSGIDINGYGWDLPGMARVELKKNIWAVRWLYLHILKGGLCLRPPYSMVEHEGFDESATNASDGSQWANSSLRPSPGIPEVWPDPVENPQCRGLWQAAYPPPERQGYARRVWRKLERMARGI